MLLSVVVCFLVGEEVIDALVPPHLRGTGLAATNQDGNDDQPHNPRLGKRYSQFPAKSFHLKIFGARA